MHILVTNDDGVTAPGLLALARAMRELGEVSILAPDRNWSASGHVKTLHRPLRIKSVTLDDGTQALASDGAPSDCVAMALLGMIEKKIDLVVSGINPNGNLGHDVTYSGTVTAAMEGVIAGVPAIAFSLVSTGNHLAALDYAPAGRVAQRVVNTLIAQGIAKDTLLNVNIPDPEDGQINGLRVTRQGMRVYRDALDERTDPRGRPYYWIGGDYPTGIPDDGTDFGAVDDGYVSITPLQLDLTNYPRAQEMSNWEWE